MSDAFRTRMRRNELAPCLAVAILALATGCARGQDGSDLAQLRASAERGESAAQSDLGVHYELGLGVNRDPARAAYWYRKAADGGVSVAQNNLGRLYATGNGVPRDYRAARIWFERAANQGDGEAMDNLARIYGEGDGVPADKVEALKWMYLAAAQYQSRHIPRPRDATANFDGLRATMSAGEIQAARHRADAWKPVPAWVSERSDLLQQLGIDADKDLSVTANYHWSWTARRTLVVGRFHCPSGSAVDVSRSLVVIRAPSGESCQGSDGEAEGILKVLPDGSAERLGEVGTPR